MTLTYMYSEMIITVSWHPSSLIDTKKKKEKNFCACVMRTLRTYSFNKFQIYHTAGLTIVIMLYIISPGLIYLISGSLYLLTTFIQCFHSPSLVPTDLISLCLSFFCLDFLRWVFLFLDSIYKLFHIRLISLSIMTSGSINVANDGIYFFFFMAFVEY